VECDCEPSIQVGNGIPVADEQLEFVDAKMVEFL